MSNKQKYYWKIKHNISSLFAMLFKYLIKFQAEMT